MVPNDPWSLFNLRTCTRALDFITHFLIQKGVKHLCVLGYLTIKDGYMYEIFSDFEEVNSTKTVNF